jgi:hypothetical protein
MKNDKRNGKLFSAELKEVIKRIEGKEGELERLIELDSKKEVKHSMERR